MMTVPIRYGSIAALIVLLVPKAIAFSVRSTSVSVQRKTIREYRRMSLTMMRAVHDPNHDAMASSTSTSSSSSSSSSSCQDDQRRNLLLGTVLMLVSGGSVLTVAPEPVLATYSAYAHREEDWQHRVNAGEIQYRSARQLRQQLAEIAPMNTEGSKIFCPNGPSSAVSPLMENKCGDQLAMPSVYGRTQDIVGNSIPGWTTGNTRFAGSNNLSSADIGGFPSYQFK